MWTQITQSYQVPPMILVEPIEPADAALHAKSVASCDYDREFRALQLTRQEFGRKLSTFLAQHELQWMQSNKSIAWRKAYLQEFELMALSDSERIIEQDDEDQATEDRDIEECFVYPLIPVMFPVVPVEVDDTDTLHTQENNYTCNDQDCPCHLKEVGE